MSMVLGPLESSSAKMENIFLMISLLSQLLMMACHAVTSSKRPNVMNNDKGRVLGRGKAQKPVSAQKIWYFFMIKSCVATARCNCVSLLIVRITWRGMRIKELVKSLLKTSRWLDAWTWQVTFQQDHITVRAELHCKRAWIYITWSLYFGRRQVLLS